MVGAIRNRTLVFLQEREKYHTKSEYTGGNRPLLGPDLQNAEEGTLTLPPDWMSVGNELEDMLSNIRMRLSELKEAQKQHLLPSFSVQNESSGTSVEIITDELTKIFSRAKDGVTRLKNFSKVKPQEISVKENLTKKIALEIQDLSTEFRKAQKDYLLRLRSRQQKGKTLFTIDEDDDQNIDCHFDVSFTQDQKNLLTNQEKIITQREQEMIHLAKSISELYQVFKDMAILVEEQGTLLDRIDYNIETANHSLAKGNEQLVQTVEIQKSSRNKLCILLLCVGVLFMVLAIIMKVIL